jgi:hypothetical protein
MTTTSYHKDYTGAILFAGGSYWKITGHGHTVPTRGIMYPAIKCTKNGKPFKAVCKFAARVLTERAAAGELSYR